MQANRSQSWTENAGTLRIDHRFNDNNTIFGRYNIDNGVIDCAASVIEGDTPERQFPSVELRAAVPAHLLADGGQRSEGRLQPLDAAPRTRMAPVPGSIAVAGFQTLNQSNLP